MLGILEICVERKCVVKQAYSIHSHTETIFEKIFCGTETVFILYVPPELQVKITTSDKELIAKFALTRKSCTGKHSCLKLESVQDRTFTFRNGYTISISCEY